MVELFRTNDPVFLSFVQAMLSEAGIEHMVADQNMSIVEGTLGILPRRILVAEAKLEAARGVLQEAERERLGTSERPPGGE